VRIEPYYGAYNSFRSVENLANLRNFFGDFDSLPFDGQAAEICGRVRAQLRALGTPIGAYDLQIAVIALANNLTPGTHNTREFERIEGLHIEDQGGQA
jgi:tRNA(fMet)-specific endonuclease VapC